MRADYLARCPLSALRELEAEYEGHDALLDRGCPAPCGECEGECTCPPRRVNRQSEARRAARERNARARAGGAR
jgi:hypothetical protein